MNVQAPITPAVRMRFELPQPMPSELPEWPPELPRAGVELRPTRRQRPRKLPAETIPPLSARARAVLIRHLPPNKQRMFNPVFYDDQRLLRIAARCSHADFLAQRGVGPVIAEEIQAWLKAHGKAFRLGPASPQTALAQAIGHIEAMLEGSDEGAFLAAFVALPELRRSLGVQTAGR